MKDSKVKEKNEKTLGKATVFNDQITLKQYKSSQSLKTSLHQRNSFAIHSQSRSLEKKQKESKQNQKFCFGTKSKRNMEDFWINHENRRKNPGPGEYDVSKIDLGQSEYEDKLIPFGTTIERFDEQINKLNPGPGSYFQDQGQYFHLVRKTMKKYSPLNESPLKDSLLKQKKYEVPGPGFYKLNEHFQQTQIEQKRERIKDKLQQVKHRRKQISKILRNNSENSIKSPRKTTFFYKHKKQNTETFESAPDPKIGINCMTNYKKQKETLQRKNLHDKATKYFPQLQLKTKFDLKQQPFHECNLSNNFIQKKDSAYESYIPKNQMNDPGVYHNQPKTIKCKKKSSFFMSTSKRKVF